MSDFMYQKIEDPLFSRLIKKEPIPDVIINGLNPAKKLRDYQEKAFQYFLTYDNCDALNDDKQRWALFHMATGSGKTLIMAGLILYYYQKGYRNFLFFVNQKNIVEKTKCNFLDSEHKKYLFADRIVIDGKNVIVRPVENFSESNENAINILFTTVQGLHDKLNNMYEDGISYEDFEDKAILIADEAHHLNAHTRGMSRKEIMYENKQTTSWEETVKRIFESNPDNVMLEFTATCDIEDNNIKSKYKGNPGNIVFNYPLLDFRKSGYTKDLFNLRTTLPKLDKILQAMLLSQYRLKLFEKHKIANSKPVVLCKESGEKTDLDKTFAEYLDFVENRLSETDIDRVKGQANDVVKTMFDYFDANGITSQNLVLELKEAFSKDHAIMVHSGVSNLESILQPLNDLENPDNPYRIVFTLDMLSEGWDVLNLFDIVRLYDESVSTVTRTTIQEAQLIGRGARYFPFKLDANDCILNENSMDKRKFDNEPDNELRICETLYYHCVDEARYITELRKALVETGFNNTTDVYSFNYHLKDSFKRSDVYQQGRLFVNQQIEINETNSGIPESIQIHYEKHLELSSKSEELYPETLRLESISVEGEKNYQYKVKDIETRIALKALRKFDTYQFKKLKGYFGNLESLSEFVSSEKYAGRYEINIYSAKEPNNVDIYYCLVELFEKLSRKILSMKPTYKGTEKFEDVLMSKYITDVRREKTISEDDYEERQGEGVPQSSPYVDAEFRLSLADKDWFVYDENYGTTEEKRFVKYFSEQVGQLEALYDKVYLIRNERRLHIYTFDEGMRFEPDYILILEKDGNLVEQRHYFIEPKGEQLASNDKEKLKEKFLKQLQDRGKCEVRMVIDDKTSQNFKIYGLPFYTHTQDQKFKKAFKKLCLREENE